MTTILVTFSSNQEYFEPNTWQAEGDDTQLVESVAMSLTNDELAHDEAVAQLEPFYSSYLDLDAFGFANEEAPSGATWGELLEPMFQEISAHERDNIRLPDGSQRKALQLNGLYFTNDSVLPVASGTAIFEFKSATALDDEHKEALLDCLDEIVGTPTFSFSFEGEVYDAAGSRGGSGFSLVEPG